MRKLSEAGDIDVVVELDDDRLLIADDVFAMCDTEAYRSLGRGSRGLQYVGRQFRMVQEN